MDQVCTWIIGFVVGCLAGGILGLGIPVPFRLALNGIRRRNKFTMTMAIVIFTRKLIKRADDLSFLEKEDILSSLAVIGRGGCGEVFKAQLPMEGESEEPKFIAIKKIKKQVVNEESRQLDNWSQQMQSEIRTVGYIRHRNLLPLAAHVHVQRPDCHYLVYEYMKNGSLKNALKARPHAGEEEGSGGGVRLPWPARLRVAMGIASGLEYLHVLLQPQIIHRDLKTDNVLLDDDMEAHIADFGLAKAMPDAYTHVSSLHVAGTVGYIAPEYYQTGKFTVKCDIFSFGVILAVLATGKEPEDLFFATEANQDGLVSWLHRMVQCGDYSAIDPAIAGAGHEEQILLLLRIAMLCTADEPKERPFAKEARFMLAQINNP